MQAAIHCFSLSYTREDYSSVIALGVFPALFACLSRLEANLASAGPALAGADVEEEEEEEEEKGDVPESDSKEDGGRVKGKPTTSNKSVSLQTSVWALLDFFASTWLGFGSSGGEERAQPSSSALSAAAADGGLSGFFSILFAQLMAVADNAWRGEDADG